MSTRTLRDLLAAANQYQNSVLQQLPAHLTERLQTGTLYVTVSTMPSSAALVVEGTGEALRCVDRTPPPADLGEASARTIEDGLSRLSDAARRGVAAILAKGGGIGLTITLPMGPVAMMIDDGSPEPRELMKLVLEPDHVH
jgi:hypothetical protein